MVEGTVVGQNLSGNKPLSLERILSLDTLLSRDLRSSLLSALLALPTDDTDGPSDAVEFAAGLDEDDEDDDLADEDNGKDEEGKDEDDKDVEDDDEDDEDDDDDDEDLDGCFFLSPLFL